MTRNEFLTRYPPLHVSVADILGTLYGHDEVVFVRAFDDKGDRGGKNLDFVCKDYHKAKQQLEALNADGFCISLVVNAGGQRDAEITRINAYFIDMDDGALDEQMEKINAFPLKPSLIVVTQKSLHCYWFAKESDDALARFREIQKAFIRHFGSDPAICNESRTMRLPGFYHNKTDVPVKVEVIAFDPSLRYTPDQLAEALPHPTPRAAEATASQDVTSTGHFLHPKAELDFIALSCAFIRYCVENAKVLSEPLWYAMITNLALFEGGAELIHQYSSPYPKYSRAATDAKIQRFLDSGVGPTTCETVSERGFKCPLRDKGLCVGKAPAVLCRKRIGKDMLFRMIDDLVPSGDRDADIQAAEGCVRVLLKKQNKPTAPYSIEQMQYIVSKLSAVKRPDDRAFIALMSLHPLRLEECLGLKYGDIDRTDLMIHIMRSVTHPERNQPIVKETKTEGSCRDIELVAGILSYLPEGRPIDYILGGDKPLSYTQLRRMRDRIRKDIGFDEAIVPQRFRTTVLTDIYDTTKDIKQTQAAAGHTTAAMTLKHYVKGRKQNFNTARAVSDRYGLSNA